MNDMRYCLLIASICVYYNAKKPAAALCADMCSDVVDSFESVLAKSAEELSGKEICIDSGKCVPISEGPSCENYDICTYVARSDSTTFARQEPAACNPSQIQDSAMVCRTNDFGDSRSSDDCSGLLSHSNSELQIVYFTSWARIKFSKPTTLSSVRFYYSVADSYSRGDFKSCEFEIQYSSTGSSWDTACTQYTNEAGASTCSRGFPDTPIHFMRLKKDKEDECSKSDTWFRLTVMNVFGCEQADSIDGMENPTTTVTMMMPPVRPEAPMSTTVAMMVGETKKIHGELVLKVEKAKKFVLEPNLIEVLTEAIATISNVSTSWVHDVEAKLKQRRILQDSSSFKVRTRFLGEDEAGEVEVDWTLEIPPESDGDEIVVTVYAERFNSKAISEVTETINIFVNSGALGDAYDLNVSWVYVIPEKPETRVEGTRDDTGESSILYLMLVGGAASLILVAGLVLVFVHCGRKQRRVAMQAVSPRRLNSSILRDGAKNARSIAPCTIQELLFPPDEVSISDGTRLRTFMRSLCDNASMSACKVFLTYASGTRDADVEGYGPGSFYAAAVTKVLHDHGVWCFSDLMLPDGYTRDTFDAELSSSKSAEVLVVVQTTGLYHSREALTQIYMGQRNKLKVVPLRFEENLPQASETWPLITRDDLEGMLMVSAVHTNFLKLNSIPSPPYTVPSQPFILKDFVQDLRRDLMLGDDEGMNQKTHFENAGPSVFGSEKPQAEKDSQVLLGYPNDGGRAGCLPSKRNFLAVINRRSGPTIGASTSLSVSKRMAHESFEHAAVVTRIKSEPAVSKQRSRPAPAGKTKRRGKEAAMECARSDFSIESSRGTDSDTPSRRKKKSSDSSGHRRKGDRRTEV